MESKPAELILMKPPLVVIVGETASGKSALALKLAKEFNGELICADSWTVYKGFDIGTAKPNTEEQKHIPHHLLDIADPAVGFSAVEFQKQALKVIEDITGRGKLPIMVGGTGLYIDSVLYDYQFLPAPPAGMRETLSELTADELIEKAEAMRLDMTGIDLRNKRRVIRLIENNGMRPTHKAMRENTLIIGIANDREHLRDRITLRVDTMLDAGLEQEVLRLADKYGWDAEPMKGIGYREWRQYFEGFVNQLNQQSNLQPKMPNQSMHTKQTLEQTRERIISSSMGLAKRQRTWFKRNEHIQWLNSANDINNLKNVETSIRALCYNYIHD